MKSRISPPVANSHGVLDPRNGDEPTRHALRRWLILQATLGLRPAEATKWVRETRDPLAAVARSRRPPGIAGRAIEQRIAALARCGAVALPVLCPGYPSRLAAIPDPPPLLLVQGAVDVLSRPAVAMVGARAATAYGLGVARELAAALASEGVVIVSGLARGIDRACHEAALEVGGWTVAVQARGPDDVYPAAHRQLASRIAERGAVVTELPPGVQPLRAFFPLRNRLISGLARVVVVIEARNGSGSLHTARHGLEQGVEVMAVPGEIDAPSASGTNRLIRDGAAPVLGPDDVFDRLAWERCTPVATPTASADVAVDADGARVMTALAAGPLDRGELARRLGRAAHELSRCLLDLQLAGAIEEDRDGRLRRRRKSGRSSDR